MDEMERVVGQAERAALQQACSAYHPSCPETLARLDEACRQLYRLGYEAYFAGVTVVPQVLSGAVGMEGMWHTGFAAARGDAARLGCQCDCARGFTHGRPYRVCAREEALCRGAAARRGCVAAVKMALGGVAP